MHFIGAQKPWYYTFNTENQTVIGPTGVYEGEYLVQWWSLFMKHIYTKLDEEIVSPVQIYSSKTVVSFVALDLSLNTARLFLIHITEKPIGSANHRQDWSANF